MIYEEYISSNLWSEKRKIALMRDNHRCQLCVEDELSPFPELEVHHKKYPEILGEEPVEWLITLCKFHHEIVTNGERKERYNNIEVATSDVKRITSSSLTRKEKNNEYYDLQDYRDSSVAYAQRDTSRSIESNHTSDEESIGKEK